MFINMNEFASWCDEAIFVPLEPEEESMIMVIKYDNLSISIFDQYKAL